MRTICLLGVVAAASLAATPALPQKGTGADVGVARTERPAIVTLEGTVQGSAIGRCAATTGRAQEGAHLMLETPDGRMLNLHLGPAAVVDELLDRLPKGQPLTAEAFRTDALPPDAYIAVRLLVDGEFADLRDPGTLRPVWAAAPGDRQGMGGGQGRGMGQGQGPRRSWQTPGPGGCWWMEPQPEN